MYKFILELFKYDFNILKVTIHFDTERYLQVIYSSRILLTK